MSYTPISSYNSAITTSQFIAVMRAGIGDYNGNGIVDDEETIGIHWWYRTSSGKWAEKNAYFESRYANNNETVGLDPAVQVWPVVTESRQVIDGALQIETYIPVANLYYNSSCAYYAIQYN